MTEQQENMIKECIESHHRMIKFHRSQIINLSRKLIKQDRIMESFDYDIINKSRGSD
jgi:hypothetical protein